MMTERNKDFLKSQSEKFKLAIKGDFNDLKDETFRIGKNGLILGGVLIAGYLLFLALKRSETSIEENKSEKGLVVLNPKKESTLIKTFKTAIATFILAVAKQKLLEFLENYNHSDKPTKQNTQRT